MDFFEQQHRARRNTAWILLAFLLAVAAIVVSINVVGGAIYLIATERPLLPVLPALAAVPRSAYVVTTLVVLGVILAGTLVRLNELADGGVAVAEMVGARRIARDTGSLEEKRLLNVVEEMALASGIAIPQVFVMDRETTINAFAAGYSPHEAAVVVTEGALKRLDRDQIQGVVAHEFSHILNGDMRLNIQLLGLIAGIVLIGSAGGFLMRAGGGSSIDRGDLRENRGDVRLLALGVLLWLIGSVGVFAGRLIKAAVSREREFLADASAVQFTRNPDGIGGALYKIAERGSAIVGRHAEELSHMCVGAPVGDLLEFPWMRTHPPIDERIERVLGPGAKRLLRERAERAEAAKGSPVVEAFSSPLYAKASAAAAAPTAAALVGSIGNPSPGHVDRARRLLEEVPAEVRAAAASEAGAKALVGALLLGAGDARSAQLSLIRAEEGDESAALCSRLADALAPLGARMRLPAFTLALPALKVLPQERRDRFLGLVQELIAADGKVSLGEFVLRTLLRRYLGSQPRGAPPVRHRDVSSITREAGAILSLFAHAGGGGMAAFDKGMTELGIRGGVLLSPSELRFDVVEGALDELKLLAPLKKPAFIKACVAVVMADDRLTISEGELLRAVCAALDSPLPPILETSEAAA
ncbi:MAG TPA: M48 family metalloprotease [Burkholderiales bacterium]|nr:M48 family metalloprotease [Burkholderiales bacterium]